MELEICPACQEAYQEEGLDVTDPRALGFGAFLGEDLPDHLCDEIENGEGPRCDCACHSTEKRKQRRKLDY